MDRFKAKDWSVNRLLQAAVAASLLLTAGSYLGGRYWPLELLTHFRLQFAVGASALLVIGIFRGCRASALAAFLVVVANVVPLVPYVMPNALYAGEGPLAVRIMSANVNYRNTDYLALQAQIAREDPDIVGLLEVSHAWMQGLPELDATYPYRLLRPEPGAYGLALYSRYPLRERVGSPYVEEGIQAAVSLDVEISDTQFTLILVHLVAPTTARKASLRNRQIARIVEMLRTDTNRERIVMGDLNITPWSPFYVPLEEEAGMTNAANGRGYLPTWPAGFDLLKIPIDHMLVSEGVTVQQFRTGEENGSDHLPIILDVVIADTRVEQSTAL